MKKIADLDKVKFTSEEISQLSEALGTIERIIEGKMYNLSPIERQSINGVLTSRKLFVNKAKTLMELHPEYVPNFIDKERFDAFFKIRKVFEKQLNRLAVITEEFTDTKMILDEDNYDDALLFYRNIKYLKNTPAAGITSIYEELKQFFERK